MLFASIDLGSNSFRIEIAELQHSAFKTVLYQKKTIRLAAGLDKDNNLTADIIQKSLTVLENFKLLIKDIPAKQIRVVGTQALRVAKNAQIFLDLAHSILGIPVEILKGREEARLVYRGCISHLPSSSKRRLVIDIGGGSTEFAIGTGDEIEFCESLQMGCVNTSIKAFKDRRLTQSNFKYATLLTKAMLKKSEASLQTLPYKEVYGTAGTFSAVLSVAHTLGWCQNEIISVDIVERLCHLASNFPTIDAIDIPGLKEDRREVIIGGLAVLHSIFEVLHLTEVKLATGALRAGVLVDLHERLEHKDQRHRTVDSLKKFYSTETSSLSPSLEIILKAYTGTLLDENLLFLNWAFSLINIGKTISISDYHKHGHYLLTKADLPGFSITEQNNLANLVLGHRGKITKVGTLLNNANQFNQLCLLRLAHLLDLSRPTFYPISINPSFKEKTITISCSKSSTNTDALFDFLLEQEKTYWQEAGFHLVILFI